MRRPLLYTFVAIVGLGLGAALALFEPWRAFTNTTVSEAAPAVPSPEAGAVEPTAATTTVLARGRLISHEHETSGTVTILRLPDGSRVLRIENLKTSDGPDVRVWLTDAKVIPGTSGWRVFDDGKHVELGPLKGNLGNQNYPVPDDADLTTLTSVSIWCARFHVSFGAAELTAA
ncbi:DM13 domain-containing protein [Cryptosporangium phraense]|uniref:DM13 domain-containing protein n=1 Tax=Cryptosporangium phraense TaxID=2593070 RepID=A0A545AQF9_9ACTN|nr:DM13 domain-containing protein [Cryptosporangium phraense]TQS43513.1 DM13 domain-containing protein [Cryptosporangium phraense]